MKKNDTIGQNDTIAKKSDTIHCAQCGKEFTPGSKKQIYCSAACKLKANRIKHKGGIVSPNREEVSENTAKHKVTVSDQLFIDDIHKRMGWINWYKFEDEVFGRDCAQCGKDFRTQLKLNLYCSPKCRDDALKGIVLK